jgi:hypothetical protein
MALRRAHTLGLGQGLDGTERTFWLDNAAAAGFTAQPAWEGATNIEPFSIRKVRRRPGRSGAARRAQA